MKNSQVDAAVERSIAAPRTFTSSPVSVDLLAKDLLARFNSKRITPDPRMILAGPDQVGAAAPATRLVYFLTDCDPQSVFFDPATDSFGVAWGPDTKTGKYFDEGPRDSDVLLLEHLCA